MIFFIGFLGNPITVAGDTVLNETSSNNSSIENESAPDERQSYPEMTLDEVVDDLPEVPDLLSGPDEDLDEGDHSPGIGKIPGPDGTIGSSSYSWQDQSKTGIQFNDLSGTSGGR